MLNRSFSLLILLFTLYSCDARKKNDSDKKEEQTCAFCSDSSDFEPLSKAYVQKMELQIEGYFAKNFDSLGFKGGFLVAKNGQILFERYTGYSVKEQNKKMNANTPLHLASVSKVLTATAIFRLVETGQLKLDQKVKSIFRKFPYPQISIRMLLNHRSGIPKYANFSEPDSVWGVEKVLHNNDILNLLTKFKFPLDFIPDAKFVYNNSNFAILASVVEEITDKPFKVAMNELVFEPLGMKNTFVFMLDEDKDKVSQSYSTKMELQEFDNLDAVYGDKNIYSTPRDLLKYDLAMQKDDFISKKLKKEIFRGYSYERPGVNNYGLGIRLKEWDTGQKLFFHNGWWHGNRTAYVTIKKEGVTLIAMTNANSRKVYSIHRLAALFGDYPFELEDEEEEDEPSESQRIVEIINDSLVETAKKIESAITK